MPFGAEVREDGSVHFRLWAPQARQVELSLESVADKLPLAQLEEGWFELVTREAKCGGRYLYRIDGETEVPDPASRFQPLDVQGPSEVIDPRTFDWKDDGWRGRPWEEAVIYELHVGAFTPEGTFCAAEQKLDYLRDLGVTAIELMPLSDFPGQRNWGYDGVLPFAPDSSYGRPEDLKHLIQSAHGKGLMVFLDVVYNHFGPEGNYLGVYAPQFFTERRRTPWGEAINFDSQGSRVVRNFFVHNALYWLEEYRFDGLRLDATEAIVDDSKPDILTELAQAVRQKFGDQRFIHLVLENGNNAAHYLRRAVEDRVELYDAQWNDDIHHAMHVLLTGESDGYYSDYSQQPLQQLCRCLTEGFAYQGDHSEFHGANRGEPCLGLPPAAFVSFLQNHDQVGNRAFGERITKLAPPRAIRAAMEILLLAPSPPLLFMGEEFGAISPFLFFCDFKGELAEAVTSGRRNEFARFAKFSSPETRDLIPDPNAEQTFLQSKLKWESQVRGEREGFLQLYRKLLFLRQELIVPHLKADCQPSVRRCEVGCLAIDWAFSDGAVLELQANLGSEPFQMIALSSKPFYFSGTDESPGKTLPPWSVVWSLRTSSLQAIQASCSNTP